MTKFWPVRYKQKPSGGDSTLMRGPWHAIVMTGAKTTILVHEVTSRVKASAGEAGKDIPGPLMTIRHELLVCLS